MSHVFISYSRNDRNFAEKIVQALAVNNLDTWIDWESIHKGEDWEQEIYRGIEGAEAFLFLISPDSVTSVICNREVAHAVRNGKRILPIFIANVENNGIYGVTEKFIHGEPKAEINRRNFILCRAERDNFDQAIVDVLNTIHTDYEWLTFHTELQVKALKWEQRKDSSRLLRGRELREAEQQLAEINTQKDPQPTQLQRDYLYESRREEDRQRRRLTAGLTIASLILLAIAIIAVWQWRRADGLTNLTFVRQLLVQAELVQNSRLDQALLLSVEASRRSNTVEAQNNLLGMLHIQPGLVRYIPLPEKRIAFGYSPDGEVFILLTGGTYRFWNASTGEEIESSSQVIKQQKVFTPDDKTGFAADQNKIRMWDLAAGQTTGVLKGQQIFDDQPNLSPDGSIRVVFNGKHDLQLQEVKTGKQIGAIPIDGNLSDVTKFAFSADNRVFALASKESTDPPMTWVQLWELPESFDDYFKQYGEIFMPGPGPDGDWRFFGDHFSDYVGEVESLFLSPDGQHFTVTVKKSSDVNYVLPAFGSDSFSQEPLQFESPVTALSSNCNDMFAIGRADGSISFSTQPDYVTQSLHHPGRIDGLVFSADCKRLASVGNGVIVLWDFNAKNSRLLLKSVPAADMALSGAWNYSGKATSTSPDGKTAAVSTCSQTETQFESNAACVISEIDFDGVKIRDFPRADAVGDASLVTAMALSPNGALLAVGICRDFDFFDPKPASCSPGEVWLVWIKDRSAGRVESIRLGDHPYAVTDLAFTQDGRILTSTGQNGDTMRWDMSPEAWQTYACEIAERNFTQVEWNEQFFSGQPYPGKDLTCPQYPAGE